MTEWAFCKQASPKHEDDTWVRLIVFIKNNITGKVVKRHTDTIWQPDIETMLGPWQIGNNSCDCNRRVLFSGRDERNYDDQFCGHSIYSVNIMNPENGQWLYREFDPDEKPPVAEEEKKPPKRRGRPPKKKIEEKYTPPEVSTPWGPEIEPLV